MRVLRRFHEDDRILVEQAAVAFDDDLQIAAVPEVDPGGAVGEHIRTHSRPMCSTLRPIPWPISRYHGPLACSISTPATFHRFKQPHGAGLVPARDERGCLGLDGLQRGGDVLRALDAGRVGFRTDQDKVVVHHRLALDAEAILDELQLLRAGMHEHHVRVAAPAGIERLPGALADQRTSMPLLALKAGSR